LIPVPTGGVTDMCACGRTGCPDMCAYNKDSGLTIATFDISGHVGRGIFRVGYSGPYKEDEEQMSTQRKKILRKAKQLGNAKQYGPKSRGFIK